MRYWGLLLWVGLVGAQNEGVAQSLPCVLCSDAVANCLSLPFKSGLDAAEMGMYLNCGNATLQAILGVLKSSPPARINRVLPPDGLDQKSCLVNAFTESEDCQACYAETRYAAHEPSIGALLLELCGAAATESRTFDFYSQLAAYLAPAKGLRVPCRRCNGAVALCESLPYLSADARTDDAALFACLRRQRAANPDGLPVKRVFGRRGALPQFLLDSAPEAPVAQPEDKDFGRSGCLRQVVFGQDSDCAECIGNFKRGGSGAFFNSTAACLTELYGEDYGDDEEGEAEEVGEETAGDTK